MDDRAFQLVMLAGVGVAAYALYRQFTRSTIGNPGGVVGVVGDLIVGAEPEPTEVVMPQPPGTSTPPAPGYAGVPVLGLFVSPGFGSVVHRESFHDVYPVTIELKNMTPSTITSPITFKVTEGDSVVVTQTPPRTLHPGERKRFTELVKTETVFGISNARCRVEYASLMVLYREWVIA